MPVRGPVVEPTVNVTVPVPLPELPPVMVIQASLLTAAHPQPEVVVRLTELLAPLNG